MRKTILIIDDDRAIAGLTAMWLKHAGHDTTCAYDAETALEMVTAAPPDLLVVDVRLPGMDGFELQRRLKLDPKFADIPIIFLSANVHEPARRQALASGALAFIAKPYQPAELLDAVNAALAPVLTGAQP